MSGIVFPGSAALSLSLIALAAASPASAQMIDKMPLAVDSRNAETSAAVGNIEATDTCLGADVCHDLALKYLEGEIFDPESGRVDRVMLRGYADLAAPQPQDGFAEVVAPQIELRPGDMFRFTIRNQLPQVEAMAYPVPDGYTGDASVGCEPEGIKHDVNEPSCTRFNVTNMHTHGLWVNPEGNGDNVLVEIPAGFDFTYEYNIPPDHPAGTFWYHSHLHGSTAPQVSSGMAGALIIRGDRHPDESGRGDLDLLMGPKQMRERVMLFQQIAYACRWTPEELAALQNEPDNPAFPFRDEIVPWAVKAALSRNDAGDMVTGAWLCDDDDIGGVEPGQQRAFDQLGPGVWQPSRRHTTINGIIGKRFSVDAAVGIPERWRMIHAGVRETIAMQVRRASPAALLAQAETLPEPDAPAYAKTQGPQTDAILAAFAPAEVEDSVDAETLAAIMDRLTSTSSAELEATGVDLLNGICAEETASGDPVPPLASWGVATDGLTRTAMHQRETTFLQPGYREDVVLSFGAPGIYCVIDTLAAGPSVDGAGNTPAVLGYVVVPGEVAVEAPAADGPDSPSAAEQRLRASMSFTVDGWLADASLSPEEHDAWQRVKEDLADGLMLTDFVWHEDIVFDELAGLQTVGFQLSIEDDGPFFGVGHVDTPMPGHPDPIDLAELADPAGVPAALKASYRQVSAKAYDPSASPRTLRLGSADQWLLTAGGLGIEAVGHPFHIHVNPFQVVDIWHIDERDDEGNATLVSRATGGQWEGLRGQWKDTIFTPENHLIEVRSRYQRYIGKFVLHCHILDHEDEGMMQQVQITVTGEETMHH